MKKPSNPLLNLEWISATNFRDCRDQSEVLMFVSGSQRLEKYEADWDEKHASRFLPGVPRVAGILSPFGF